jgi:uncharacterized protein
MLTINIDTARRFILGKQGLWPGRRWRGIAGTEQAMRAMEYLQLDPLQIVARSQDIQLHSRVLDYTPGMWEDLAYQQRTFLVTDQRKPLESKGYVNRGGQSLELRGR